jgi:CheY-like chemotaxis protein
MYSLYRLGTVTDIDTVMGMKKASSRGEYFRLLDEFTYAAPDLVKALKEEELDVRSSVCVDLLDRLQSMILQTASPSLLWKMARLVSSIRWGSKETALENFLLVQKSVDLMCEKIMSAKTIPPPVAVDGVDVSAADENPAENETSPAENGNSLPPAPVNPEIFEKTFMLIENEEFDYALIDLQVLLAFSYTKEIDRGLRLLLARLRHGQHETAQSDVTALRQLVEAAAVEKYGRDKKKRILAIDDFPDTLRILKTGLQDKFDITGVTNHTMALKYLTACTADLILLDIEMPDMDGYTLLDIIRKLGNYKTTPVLFLTANASARHVKMAIEHGGNDFIKKPVDLELLTEKILKHLQIEEEREEEKQ